MRGDDPLALPLPSALAWLGFVVRGTRLLIVWAASRGDGPRARGMSKVAAEAGISRGGLYKALGEGGNPSLETLSAILRTLGMRLSVVVAQ